MPAYIIHHNNTFNVYSTITDSCYFESGMTIDELKEWYELEYGKRSMIDFDLRIERCIKNGTSSFLHSSLKECVSANRAGPNETRISYQKFIDKYLTIGVSSKG